MGRGVGTHPEHLRVEGGQVPAPLEPNKVHLHYTPSLLHSTLSITVHFNGSNETAYTRPFIVHNTYVQSEVGVPLMSSANR
jgi:hypothetical protein